MLDKPSMPIRRTPRGPDGLTTRQRDIRDFIVACITDDGLPPSIYQIRDHFGIRNIRAVTGHLEALEKKGAIQVRRTRDDDGKSHRVYRGISVPGMVAPALNNAVRLPLVGTIAAGIPITAEENVEAFVAVSPDVVGNCDGGFLLRVRGDSMIDAHILPGDMVVIRPQETAQNGDIVAALIGDEATLKRFERDGSRVRLMPANDAYEPIPIDREDTRILGKMIGLLRGCA